MTNIQIAHQYAKKMATLIKDKGIWHSNNLPMLTRSERKAVLKVYKKYWKKVEYNSATGNCVCSFPKV